MPCRLYIGRPLGTEIAYSMQFLGRLSPRDLPWGKSQMAHKGIRRNYWDHGHAREALVLPEVNSPFFAETQ